MQILDGEELARQERDWKGYKRGLVRLTPGPWVFPKPFLNFADKYYKFQVLVRVYVCCMCVCVCVCNNNNNDNNNNKQFIETGSVATENIHWREGDIITKTCPTHTHTHTQINKSKN